MGKLLKITTKPLSPLKNVGGSGDILHNKVEKWAQFSFFRFFPPLCARSLEREKVGKSHSRIGGVKTILAPPSLVGVRNEFPVAAAAMLQKHFSALYPAIFPVHRPPHLRGQLNTLIHQARFSGIRPAKMGANEPANHILSFSIIFRGGKRGRFGARYHLD